MKLDYLHNQHTVMGAGIVGIFTASLLLRAVENPELFIAAKDEIHNLMVINQELDEVASIHHTMVSMIFNSMAKDTNATKILFHQIGHRYPNLYESMMKDVEMGWDIMHPKPIDHKEVMDNFSNQFKKKQTDPNIN